MDLPEAVRSAVVPAARPVTSDAVSPSVGSLLTFLKEAHSTASNVVAGVAAAFPQDTNLQRRLLGGGIILLTLLFTALMAWKLPMRRQEYWETWRVQLGFRYRYAYSGENHAAVRSTKDGETAGRSGKEITTSGNRAARPWGMLALARTRRLRLIRRGEKQGPRRHKRKRLATGAYTPHARRYLRNMSKGASRKPASRSTRPLSGSSRSAKASAKARSAAMRRRRKMRSR